MRKMFGFLFLVGCGVDELAPVAAVDSGDLARSYGETSISPAPCKKATCCREGVTEYTCTCADGTIAGTVQVDLGSQLSIYVEDEGGSCAETCESLDWPEPPGAATFIQACAMGCMGRGAVSGFISVREVLPESTWTCGCEDNCLEKTGVTKGGATPEELEEATW